MSLARQDGGNIRYPQRIEIRPRTRRLRSQDFDAISLVYDDFFDLVGHVEGLHEAQMLGRRADLSRECRRELLI